MPKTTKTFTVTASSSRVMDRFERLLALLHWNGQIGHSGKFGMDLDGDGPERLMVEPKPRFCDDVRDAKLPRSYPVFECANDEGFHTVKIQPS